MFEVKKTCLEKYVFVNGNTKYLKDCTESEIKTLIENGHRQWFVKKTEESSGGNQILGS